MDILDTLRSLLADQNMAVDPAWTDEMVSAYPYMVLPAILELQRNTDMSAQRRSMRLQRAAVTAPLTETLHTIAEPDAIDPLNFYPPQPAPQSMTTEQVIDSFITRYGPADSGSEEAVLERLIFNPTPDYGSILEAEEENSLPDEAEATGDGQDALINAFILKSRRLPRHSSFPSPDDSISPPRPNLYDIHLRRCRRKGGCRSG
ncbi:MAG: hypothetical protein K2M98_06880, partial [Muribaculum sp.]|nr:hypothetical protein [Muribaculum sp.]